MNKHWSSQLNGWIRTDGFRIETPNPEAMLGGAWFGLAFAPGAMSHLPEFIKGLDANAAMNKIDATFPMKQT